MGNFDDIIRDLTDLQEQDTNTDFSTSVMDPPSSTSKPPYSETILEAQKAFSKNNVQAKKAEKVESLSLAKTHFKNTSSEKDKLGMPRNEAYVHMIQLADKALTGNISKDQENEIRSKLNQFDTMHKAAKWRPGIGQDLTPVDDFVVQFVRELEELNITAAAPFTTSPLAEGFTPSLPAPSTVIEDEITPKLPGSPGAKPAPPPPTYSETIASEVKALTAIPSDARVSAKEPSKPIVSTSGGLDLNEVTANEQVTDILNEIGTSSRKLTATSPVEKQFGPGLARHTDKTWSVTTVDGKTIIGLDEVTARAYKVYNERYDAARKAGAPTSTITNKFYEYLRGWIDISTWGLNNVTGSTTLVERIQSHNADIAEKSIRLNKPYDPNVAISADDLDQYRAIKQATELSTADLAFMETPKFKAISELEDKAVKSKDTYNFIQNTAENLKAFIPVDDKEFRAAHMVFKTLQRTEGNMAALGNAISEDLLTYMGQFAGSIPYMTMLTAGGPIAQASIFYAFAEGKSRKAIEEWSTKYGAENLTPEIITRIEAFTIVDLLFEKLSAGYVVKLLNKSLPLKAQLAWVTKVRETVKLQTPSSIQTLTTLTGRLATALGVEAISGGGSEWATQMGEHGEIRDADAIVHGAFAESAAVFLAGPGMIAQSQLTKAAIAAVTDPAIDNKARAEEQITNLEARLSSNVPLTFGDTAESEDTQKAFKEINNTLTDVEKGKESQTYKRIYDDLIDGGTPHKDALKLADEIFEDSMNQLIKDKQNLTKILNTPLAATDEADIRNRFETTINILKQAVAEGDIGRKKAKDLAEQTAASQRGQLVSIEDEAFDLALADIDVSETADVEKTWKQIEKLGNRKLTDEQNKALSDVAVKFESIAATETTKKEEPVSFGSLENVGEATDEILAEEISDPDISKTDKELLEAEKDSRESNKKREDLAKELAAEAQETKDKNLEQVSKEILQGKSEQWRGFDTYRALIEEVFRDSTRVELLRNVEILRIEGDMNTLLNNLEEKLKQFKATRELFRKNPPQPYTTPPSATHPNGQKMPAKVWVIYGHQNPSTGRSMNYTIPTKPVSLKKYKEEKEKKGRIAFVIDGKSDKLIRTLEAEVQYGKDTIKVVKGHKNTSYARKSAEQTTKRKKTGEIVGYLRRFMTDKLNRKTLLTQEEIEQADIDSKAKSPPITKTTYSDKKRWPTRDLLKTQLAEFKKALKKVEADIVAEDKSEDFSEEKQAALVKHRDDIKDNIREIENELKLRDEKGETPPPTSKLQELKEELESGVRSDLIQSLAEAKRDRDGETPDKDIKGKTDKELERLYNTGIERINDFIQGAKTAGWAVERTAKQLLKIKNNNPVLRFGGGRITHALSFSGIIKAGKLRTSAEIQAEIAKLTKKDAPPPPPPPPTTPPTPTSDEEIEEEIEVEEEAPGPEAKRPPLFTDKEGNIKKANNGQWIAIEKIKTWFKQKSERRSEINKIFVLQGRAGTGKTTIVEATLDILKIDPDDVRFALPTHKAKQVIQNATQAYSEDSFSTIDSLLGQRPIFVPVKDAETGKIIRDKQGNVKEYKQIFRKDESDEAEEAADKKIRGQDGKYIKLIVIDEASMINEKFTSELIELAISKNIRLLFMGDNVQLPPIEDETGGKKEEGVTVSWVFDTVMKINQKPYELPIPDTSYAKLTKRMRQDEGNPILGITDILANVAEYIHKNHGDYIRDFGNTKLVSFVLPLIKNKSVQYMEGIGSAPKDDAVESFAKEYEEAKISRNEKNIKFITYNNAEHPTTKALRRRIRPLIFPEVDSKKAEDIEGTPFLVGERIVLDKNISILKRGEPARPEYIHNGDELTVQEEIYDGTVNHGQNLRKIPVRFLKVKTDEGAPYTLILDKPSETEKWPDGKPKSESQKQIYKQLDDYQRSQGVHKKLKIELFTSGLSSAYLIDSHKAQGSTYDTVYANYGNILSGRHGADFLSRVKSLYVATSRPRHRLVLVGGSKLTFGTGEELKANKKIEKKLKAGPQKVKAKPKQKPEVKSEKVKFTRLDKDGEDISVTGTVIKHGDKAVLGITKALDNNGFDVIQLSTKQFLSGLTNIADEIHAIEAAKSLAPILAAQSKQKGKPKPKDNDEISASIETFLDEWDKPWRRKRTWWKDKDKIATADFSHIEPGLIAVKVYVDDIGDEKVITEKYGSKVNGVTITQHVDVIEAHNLDFDKVTPGWMGRDGSFIFNPLAPPESDISPSVDFEGETDLNKAIKKVREQIEADSKRVIKFFGREDREIEADIREFSKKKGNEKEIEDANAELTKRRKDRQSKRKGEISDEAPPISDETSDDVGKGTGTRRNKEQEEWGDLTEEIVGKFIDTADAVQWLANNTLNNSFKVIAQEILSKIDPGSPIKYQEILDDIEETSISPFIPGKDIGGTSTFRPDGTHKEIKIGKIGLREITLLHELLHQAAGGAYRNPKTPEQKAAIKQLQKIAKEVGKVADSDAKIKKLIEDIVAKYPNQKLRHDPVKLKTALKAIGHPKGEELITHGLTNSYVQFILQNMEGLRTPPIKEPSSLWENFTQSIRKLLGIPDSVNPTLFDQVLEASAVFIADERKGDKRFLAKESYSKQAFRALYPEIITPEGELADKAELDKHSSLLNRLAKQLTISATEEQEAADDKSGLIAGINSILKKLPESVNFIEGSPVLFPATVRTEELQKNILEREALKGLEGDARSLKIQELMAKNQEMVLGLLGKRFSELVGMRPGSRGIHTIPDEAFVYDIKHGHRLLKQALIDLMSKPVVAEGDQFLLPFSPDETKKAEIEKAANTLVEQYKVYKRRYKNIAYDLNSRTNTDIDESTGKKKGPKINLSLTDSLSLLHRIDSGAFLEKTNKDEPETDPKGNGRLPPQLVFTMMLGITVWRQYHRDNIAFQHKSDKERFLYNSQDELTTDESTQLDYIKFNYQETANDVGLMIASMMKMFAKKDVKHADLYYSNLIPQLGMAALQIEHGRFDKKTLNNEDYADSDHASTPYDEESKIQIEVRKWTFDPPYAENRNYNNRITQSEADTLSSAVDENGNKLYRNKVEPNNGQYKHVRVNTDTPITKNQSLALKLILKTINSNVDPEANFPLQTPVKVDRFIPKAIGGVPNRVFGVLKDIQKNPSTANKAMGVVAKLANSKYKNVLNGVIGIEDLGTEEEQKATHKYVRQSTKSANDHKKNGLDAILEAFSLGYLKEFFYKYKLQNTLRILQVGKINPQQNKVHRSLVRTYEPMQYNENNIELFKLAVVHNFGVKIHLQEYNKSMRQFNDIISDEHVQIAAKAIANLEDKGQLEKLAEALPLIQDKFNGDVGLFPALTGLSEYMPNGIPTAPESEFTSDLIFEADAQASGHTINILQFPQFHDADGTNILEETLNKVGIYIGKTEEETYHDPTKPGPYNDLASLITNYEGLDAAERRMEEDRQYFVPKNYEDKNIAINTLYPDMGNEEDLRDVVKYPFIMSIYGGGDVTIPQHVSKLVIKSLYVSLDKLQKAYISHSEKITTFEVELKKPKETYTDYYKILEIERDANKATILRVFRKIKAERDVTQQERTAVHTLINTDKRKSYDRQIKKSDEANLTKEIVTVTGKEDFIRKEVIPFVDNLTTIEAFKQAEGRQIAKAFEVVTSIAAISNGIGKSQDLDFNDSHIIRDMGNVLSPRFHYALKDLVGGTKAARDAVIAEGEILHAVFKIAYDEAYEKALIISKEKRDGEGKIIRPEIKRSSLTEKETIALIREKLIDIFPQISNPLANQSDSAIDRAISLLRAVPGKEKNPLETSQFKFKNQRHGTSVTETSHRTVGYELPGVAALIRGIINFDAGALTELLNTIPTLGPIHDSTTGSPKLLLKATPRYGNVLLKINRENNILTRIIEQVDKTIKNVSPEILEEANKWILEHGYQNKIAIKRGDNPLSIEEIRDQNAIAQRVNQRALKQMHDRFDNEGVSAKSHMFIPTKKKGDDTDYNLYKELTKEVEDTVKQLSLDFKDVEDTPLADDIVPSQELTDRLKEFTSLDNLRRDNPAPVEDLIGDLQTDTIKTMFKKIQAESGNYYKSPKEMSAHTSMLTEVFDLLAQGMDATTRITLDTEQIDGITHGRFTEEINRIRLSVSRKPPLAVNSQSPQEVYVHEVVHAMTSIAMKDNPIVVKRVARLYNQIEKQLKVDFKGKGHHVFLAGVENPSVEDRAMALKQYNFIFNYPENEANKLHEFLAYALTNKQLSDFIKTKDLKLPERKGIFSQLMHILDVLVDTFVKLLNRRFYSKYGSKYFLQNINAYHEMLATVEHLVAIQSKHQSILMKFQSKSYKYLSMADKKLLEFQNKLFIEMSTHRDSPLLGIPSDSDDGSIASKVRTVTGAVSLVPRLALSDDPVSREAREIPFTILKEYETQNSIHKLLNKTLRSVADEIGGGVLSEALIEQLMHAKVNISKARQIHERYITGWFNKIWKSVDATKDGAMSVELREAITSVVLQTDLTSLLNINISGNDIVKILGDEKFRKRELSAIEKTFKKSRGNKDKALQWARELGFWLATGNRALPLPHLNAYTIAHKYLIDPTTTDIAYLDAYATISSLEHLNPRELAQVKGLGEREFAKNATVNGFTDLLNAHRVFKANSLEGLFYGNPTQMIKGYIVERVDNLTHIKIDTIANKKQKEQEGYHEAYKLGDIPGISSDLARNTIYVTRIIPEVTDASGIMSTTNQRAMGTTLTEIYSKNPKFWHKTGENKNKPDFRLIKATIKLVKQSEDKKAKASKVKENPKLRLTPIMDENQNITDFRVMMNHEDTKEILRPDLEAQNVFAHMNSGYVDRANTLESDKRTVDILVHEQQDLYKSHKHLFVDLLDPNEKHVERYRKLPRPVREYIKRYAVGNQFMVREDIIDKVFGYKVADITQLEALQKPELARVKLIAGILHNIIKSIVTYGKNRIVIAMPQVVINNLMSNVYQLSMRHIPMSYILSKVIEGKAEFERYRNDKEKLMELQHKIKIRNLNEKTSPEGKEVTRLLIRLEGNKVHRMNEAGLDSLIKEDVNEAQIDGFFNQARRRLKVNHRHSKWTDPYIGKIPKKIGPWKTSDIGAVLFMTKGSKPYQIAHHTVHLTDFLGRYVLIEHLVNVEKLDFKTAMHRAINAFVLFDEVLTPALEALDAIGATSFLSYYLRNNRASRQLVQTNPVGVGLSAAFQHTTGINSLGNVNSSWLGGDFSPNLMQFDELFDEANNMTGVDIVTDVVRSIFD